MGNYFIVRMYERADVPNQIIDTGLTLEEAKAHCRDPETSSSTATSTEALMRTRNFGRWFDGYEEYKPKDDMSL